MDLSCVLVKNLLCDGNNFSSHVLWLGISSTSLSWQGFSFLHQSMWRTSRSTVDGYFLAGRNMTWWPVSQTLQKLCDDNHNGCPVGLDLLIFSHVSTVEQSHFRLQYVSKVLKWNAELIQIRTLSSVFRWVPRSLPVTLAVVILSVWQGQELQQELGPLPTNGMWGIAGNTCPKWKNKDYMMNIH